MDAQAFASAFISVTSNLEAMIKALEDDPSLLGCMSIEDYTLFQNLVKEYTWMKEV